MLARHKVLGQVFGRKTVIIMAVWGISSGRYRAILAMTNAM